jgi:hypothetical protein
MKKDSNKITFGDFSASEYLFSKVKKHINAYNKWGNIVANITRDEFIKFFGTQKPLKHNRYSWSGSCVPTYNTYNDCGQILTITDINDICILYSHSKDKRLSSIKNLIPKYLQKDDLLIAIWKSDKMESHINKKFNNKGFFIIKKTGDTFNKICFGKPFNYASFICGIIGHKIIFDSGMHIGNNRNYSHFRSLNSNFFNDLIIEEYE